MRLPGHGHPLPDGIDRPYNEILADYSSPLKLVKSRAFISALLPHLTFVNGANVPSIRYGIRKYVLGEGMR